MFNVCKILLLFIFTGGIPATAFAQSTNTSDPAFNNHNYPWFNPETKGYEPINIPIPPKNELPESKVELPEGSLTVVELILRILFWVLVILIISWLVILIVRTFWDFQPVADETETEEQLPQISQEKLDLLPEVTRGVKDFLGEAKAYAMKGDFSQAMIYYYAWQLLMLDQQEIIELECGKTNRQYLREANKHSTGLSDIFQKSIQNFEDAIYGGIKLLSEDFDMVWDRRSMFSQRPQKNNSTSNIMQLKKNRKSS